MKIIISLVITIIFHEFGHYIFAVLFTLLSNKKVNTVEIVFKKLKISVVHDSFENKNYNLIVALAGPIMPLILSSIMILIGILPQINESVYLISYIHLIFLTSIFTDGKNIKKICFRRNFLCIKDL